jgi:hypothetical protein
MTPLHYLGELLRSGLGSIPLSLVRVLFVGTLVIVLLWVLRLPREATTAPGGSGRWDGNLKLAAGLALAIQIVIYLVL